jgi:uncharacterized DUF497 family protein
MPLKEFMWDENKRLSNLAKHGPDFEDAHWVFTDEAFAAENTRRQYGEPARARPEYSLSRPGAPADSKLGE